jgi:signal transduction histidine kinase
MRIQTRLFVVIASLVLALVVLQLWLHQRQLKAMERGLGMVATSVGRDLMTWRFDTFDVLKNAAGEGADTNDSNSLQADVMVFAAPEERGEVAVSELGKLKKLEEDVVRRLHRTTTHQQLESDGEGPPRWVTHSEIKVEVIKEGEADGSDEPVLMISDADGKLKRIPIPTSATATAVRSTMRQGLLVSGGVLLVGLLASAVVAQRLGRPLRDLARQSEMLGEGDLGLRFPVTAGGEVGELQAAFDRLSQRLAELEQERERWQRREHLAQLGDLARGLAHTVRNPLHTLGLAVEELSGEAAPGDLRVATARAQIRRVDRWVCSFLAIGAGNATEPETVDVAEVVEDAVLEGAQQGARIEMRGSDEAATVRGVAAGLRAAVSNLLENAVHAAPDEVVEVAIETSEETVRVAIRDRGPGLPEAVRDRLFTPHVSERPGGAGMGLYLAQRLVVDLHGGTLELEETEDGGTTAVIVLPQSENV